MHQTVLAFAALSFSGPGDIEATAAPAFWQGPSASGGHLRPNGAGYRLMSDSIDLRLFK
jgi:hypothetical protein